MSSEEDGRSWHEENITPDLLQRERIERVIYSGRTAYQAVRILDLACFGRTLVLDGHTQSTQVDEFVYHEALVHPSLLSHPNPSNVFIAGGGEGATLREVLAHRSVSQVVMVDIDREVVELCQQHLPSWHQGAFQDPRVSLHFADAQRFLEEDPQRYDVIIVDVPDPLENGPAYQIFTQEFYRLALDRLTDQGLVVAQAGHTGPAYYEQCFPAVVRTMNQVFPHVFPCEAYVPSFGSEWGFVMGSRGPNPLELDPQEVDALISRRITRKLRFYDGITHRGMFSLPKYLRRAIEEETRLITLAQPLFVP